MSYKKDSCHSIIWRLTIEEKMILGWRSDKTRKLMDFSAENAILHHFHQKQTKTNKQTKKTHTNKNLLKLLKSPVP